MLIGDKDSRIQMPSMLLSKHACPIRPVRLIVSLQCSGPICSALLHNQATWPTQRALFEDESTCWGSELGYESYINVEAAAGRDQLLPLPRHHHT